MEVDYLNYSLQELHEAWMTIDDYAYPERAIRVYQLLKNAEAKATEDNSSNASSTWVVSVLRNFSRPSYITQALAIYYWKKVVQR